MQDAVLVAGARTPIGRFLGGLAGLTAADLGVVAIREALARAGLSGADVDAVLMGNVVQAGGGPNPARIAAVGAGVPMSAPATTVNKLCLSGLATVAQAAQLIALGQYDVVVAGGMESMSNAPHLLRRARKGLKFGADHVLDALESDALTCAFDGIPMGEATDRYQTEYALSRSEQDEYAAESHARAARATKEGLLAEEIVPITAREGSSPIEQDEGIRASTTAERLATLKPAFSSEGTITAGSSSQLSDGACALVVMSKRRAQELGVGWLAEIGGYGTVAGPDPSLLKQPAEAIRDAARRDGELQTDQLDLVEINEAFAGVPIVSTRELKLDPARVNVNGGAIALGHPVGMSGARLLLSLSHELRRRGGGTGAAALCGGGGQGDALVLRVPKAA
ncbi:acetyl-CoA C-acyltransferase [Saccharopolyspora endophytica]|uniref:Probable acetyl-CoA acetyltransferase n=1 Tax=Saccharopolyspora endophytica TaxID=543886 RepID=A0ABS5DB33_9PSEU|nr:acetyl-CoA C-acyltransferase [Saccharopolyspora endophytica]MBQ0923511.1 acetyl-CoA C-acyltransferase [Saccharopolyspora endophytica]